MSSKGQYMLLGGNCWKRLFNVSHGGHYGGVCSAVAAVHYDICVVGAGTIGSAAARHIAEARLGHRVLLIGPFEKGNRSDIDIHGAYYDKGRLTRVLDAEPAWAELGRRSVARYRDIEKRSGIPFYGEVGFLGIGTPPDVYCAGLQASALQQGHAFERLNVEKLREKFPFFRFKDGEEAIYTQSDGGYVNIREMVAAQRLLAERSGCDIRDDVIKKIIPPSDGKEYNVLVTDTGCVLHADRVLLTTGAFTQCRELLPAGLIPDVKLTANVVLKIEIPEDSLRGFSGMPSILSRGSEVYKDKHHAYILPPILYPDGKYYIKIGHGLLRPAPVNSHDEIHAWFNRKEVGYPERHVQKLARRYFHGLENNRHNYDYCVTVLTPTGYPYIDMVTSSLGVAIAGNGRAAKCADEIGRVAAKMIMRGQWDSDIPPEYFKFKSKLVAKM